MNNIPTSDHHFNCALALPFEADRVCELAVECWTLRNGIFDKSQSNAKLKSYIERLKFSLQQSTEVVNELRVRNMSKEKENKALLDLTCELKNKMEGYEKDSKNLRNTLRKRRSEEVIFASRLKKAEDSVLQYENQRVAREKEWESRLLNIKGHYNQDLIDTHLEKIRLSVELNELKSQHQKHIIRIKQLEEENLKAVRIIDRNAQREKEKRHSLTPVSPVPTLMREKAEQQQKCALLEQAFEELHCKLESVWEEREAYREALISSREETAYILASALRQGCQIELPPRKQEIGKEVEVNDIQDDNSRKNSNNTNIEDMEYVC